MSGPQACGVAALALLALAGCASATSEGVSLDQGWARATAPWVNTAAIYADLTGGADDDRLLGASSSRCTEVQLHRTDVDGAVASMSSLDSGVDIPAGTTVRLEPGGIHAMCLGIDEPLQDGTMLPVELTFESGTIVSSDIPIQGP